MSVSSKLIIIVNQLKVYDNEDLFVWNVDTSKSVMKLEVRNKTE